MLFIQKIIQKGWTGDIGTTGYGLLGLAEMIKHIYIWILGKNGMVKYVGVE